MKCTMGNDEPKETKKSKQKPLSTRYVGNLLRKDCVLLDSNARRASAKVFITEEKKVKKRKVNELLATVPIACVMKQFDTDSLFTVVNGDVDGLVVENAAEDATIRIYYHDQYDKGPRSFVQGTHFVYYSSLVIVLVGRTCVAIVDLGRELPEYEVLRIVACSLDDHEIIKDFYPTDAWKWAVGHLDHQQDELPGLVRQGSVAQFDFHAFKTISAEKQHVQIKCQVAIVPTDFEPPPPHSDDEHDHDAVSPGGMDNVGDQLGPPWDTWEAVIGPFQ